ncbi:hypothetical protein BKA70DRAFT_1227443 [Coprinopsis sp. MPI-PUGE-AT-0042]|nr:hypothetical protein BKA70DRAFT_1227443 [Coprinopsis sp. MPI-PUGE-AT-0042]
MYYYLISNYARPWVLLKASWTILRLIALIAQSYFTYVSFKLMWWIACIIGSLVVAHFGLGTTLLVGMAENSQLQLRLGSNTLQNPRLHITGVIAEFMITACLCIFLKMRETKFRGFWRSTRLYSAFATIEVVLMESKPGAFYYMAVDLIIGKLFVKFPVKGVVWDLTKAVKPSRRRAETATLVVAGKGTTELHEASI